MPRMVKILEGVKIQTLLAEIEANPDLWNRYEHRTRLYNGSPHAEVDDIWIRYNAIENFDPLHPELFGEEHESVYYPESEQLPSLVPLLGNLCAITDTTKLGGVLITRIPAGKKVDWHNDGGRWHSEYYLNKYLLLLKSAPGQKFRFENEEHEGAAGDMFLFDNRFPHCVENNSDTDRISLILACRCKSHDHNL